MRLFKYIHFHKAGAQLCVNESFNDRKINSDRTASVGTLDLKQSSQHSPKNVGAWTKKSYKMFLTN